MSDSSFTTSYNKWQSSFFDVYAYDKITITIDFSSVGTAASFTFALLAAPHSTNKANSSASWAQMKVEAGVAKRDEIQISVGDLVNNKFSFSINTAGLSRISLVGKSSDGTGTAAITSVVGSAPVALTNLQPGA